MTADIEFDPAQAAFPPPPAWQIPVSYGRDLIMTFRNLVPGTGINDPTTGQPIPPQYINFPDGYTVTLVVTNRRNSPVASAPGVIDGDLAKCKIPATMVDTFKTGYLWRCVVTVPDSGDTDDDVPVNGVLIRCDGNEDDDGT